MAVCPRYRVKEKCACRVSGAGKVRVLRKAPDRARDTAETRSAGDAVGRRA